jgi:hypothetical protein
VALYNEPQSLGDVSRGFGTLRQRAVRRPGIDLTEPLVAAVATPAADGIAAAANSRRAPKPVMMPSEITPLPTSPPIAMAMSITTPSATEMAGSYNLDLVICTEDLLNRTAEVLREGQGQRQ